MADSGQPDFDRLWNYDDPGGTEQHFRDLLPAAQQSDDVVTIRIADWCIGRCLRSLGRIEDALAKQQNLLRQHEQAATSDGYVYEEIAECLSALNRQAEAKLHFARAYAELSQDDWLVGHEPERLERLKQLAER